jgi:hypothetical protein
MKFVVLICILMIAVLFPTVLYAQGITLAQGSNLASMTVGQTPEPAPSTLDMAWVFIRDNADCRAQYVYSFTDHQSYAGYTAMFPVWKLTPKVSLGVGVLGYINDGGIHLGSVGGVTLKHLVWIFDASIGYSFPDQWVGCLGINKAF